ncbi:MAG: sugar transferase [bacterium]
MLKEHQFVFQRANMAIDFVLTVVAIVLSHFLRNELIAPYLFPSLLKTPSNLTDYQWLLYILPFVMVAFLAHNGCYMSQRVRSYRESLKQIILSSVETALAALVIGFFIIRRIGWPPGSNPLIADKLSRGVIILLPFVLTVLVALKTLAVRQMLVTLRMRGYNWRSLLLVGSGASLRDFICVVRNHPFWGFCLKGIIDESGREARMVEDVPVLGNLSNLIPHLERHPVDEVVFIPGKRSLEELAPYFEACEEMGMRTRLSLNFYRPSIARPVLDPFQDLPVVTYSPTKMLNWALMIKYAFDTAAAFILLVLLSPLFLIIGLAIKLTSRRWSDPVFYGQMRCGLNGRRFTVWKFRSMRTDADRQLSRLMQHNEMTGPVFKMKEDPRITSLGKWLRKTSLDELPQLWNVLCGQMSLVGPRPPIPDEVEKYDRWQRRRLSMKPGITCLWQVMGRNQIDFNTWMKLDLEYIDNWSLWLDFKILLRTVYVVTTGYGAM